MMSEAELMYHPLINDISVLNISMFHPQKKTDDTLVNRTIKDSHHFTIVDVAGFRDFVGILDPTYILHPGKR